jgi:hypothetical protein
MNCSIAPPPLRKFDSNEKLGFTDQKIHTTHARRASEFREWACQCVFISAKENHMQKRVFAGTPERIYTGRVGGK